MRLFVLFGDRLSGLTTLPRKDCLIWRTFETWQSLQTQSRVLTTCVVSGLACNKWQQLTQYITWKLCVLIVFCVMCEAKHV